MPCRDWDGHNADHICDLKEQLAKAPKPHMLCEAMSVLENHGLLGEVSQELRAWYGAHEKDEADKVRLEAAEKLTERERRLLGIDLASLKNKVK